MSNPHTTKFSRRELLSTAAAAATVSIVPARTVRGAAANSAVMLGLIGCGGRGRWIAELFRKHGKYRFVACADYFAERAAGAGAKHGVPARQCYSTLSGYKRLLEQQLDAVVIETPPYFHPQQAAAAVAAGKHVFLAKPVAVDPQGCLSIAESGKRATASKRVFLVDFQTRANPIFREAARRIRAGQIGPLVCGEARYPWAGGGRGWVHTDAEDRLRRWSIVKEISGDFIVEQSIHSLDIATWFVDAAPTQAVGAGGKTVRLQADIWDHFAVIYRFPKDIVLSFFCVQSIPGVKDEISCRIFGADGVAYGDYFGDVWIRGKTPYEGGTMQNLYTSGTEVNIAEFHEAVVNGDAANPSVAPSVRSNLTAILGRMAGYCGQAVTWDEMLRSNERWEPDLSGLRG